MFVSQCAPTGILRTPLFRLITEWHISEDEAVSMSVSALIVCLCIICEKHYAICLLTVRRSSVSEGICPFVSFTDAGPLSTLWSPLGVCGTEFVSFYRVKSFILGGLGEGKEGEKTYTRGELEWVMEGWCRGGWCWKNTVFLSVFQWGWSLERCSLCVSKAFMRPLSWQTRAALSASSFHIFNITHALRQRRRSAV